MKLRFVEYDGGLYVVVGFTYDTAYEPAECYVAAPLKESIFKSSVIGMETVKIPIDWGKEISDKEQIRTIMVLYGW